MGKGCELIKAGGTRFGTHTLVGERLLKLKAALQATVVDAEYVAQKYKDAGDSEDQRDGKKTVRTNKGATTRNLVIDDDGFWDRVSKHVHLTMPLFKMLRRFDTNAPAIGKVYSSWYEAGEHLKQSAESPYQSVAIDRHADRWAYGHSDFAAAAYMLDPEFHKHNQASNEEVVTGFMNTVEKIGILLAVREGDFTEAWKKRVEYLGNDPQKQASWECYPTYPTNSSASVKSFCCRVNQQLTLYRAKKGVFSRDWVMEEAQGEPAYLWWSANGASASELQTVACLVLSQPASASVCERINSEFGFVKDPRRNRLEHNKANKLVALFHNLRLLNRVRQPQYSEPAVGWNTEDEKSGVTKYGVAHYEPCKITEVKALARPAARMVELQQLEAQQHEVEQF